jgi:hypothetical protein
MRDWMRTLSGASYKGVPFYVQTHGLTSGRRLVVHQFPNRDTPFVEDLGAESRSYKVTAYLVGDDADAVAVSFQTLLNARGHGQLNLPLLENPVPAHVKSWTRSFDKDKLGFIAFEIEFVREGAPGAFGGASVLTLGLSAQLAFDAAGRLAALAGPLMSIAGLGAILTSPLVLAGSLTGAVADRLLSTASGILGQPLELVASGARFAADAAALAGPVIGSVDTLAAMVSVLRQDSGLPASENAAATRQIVSFVADAPSRVTSRDDGVGIDLVEIARAIGEAGDPDLVYASARDLFDAVDSADVLVDAPRLLLGVVLAEAALRRTFSDRPSGVTARADVSSRLSVLAASFDPAIAAAARDLRDRTVEYLSRLITDLAPVVTVSAGRSLPSLWWAWRLYQDPARAVELAARNRVPHPSFMPRTFEALAS